MLTPMKTLFALFCSLFVITNATGTNYYMSNSGNDANSGLSSSLPWQTITRLNFTTYSPGDSIFFRCGDTFRGDITVNQSGTSTSRITFTSYSSGAKPIISGAQIVTTWTQMGNYYTTNYTGTINNFFVNNREQTIARYPNEHVYLTLDSAQGTYLKDAALTSLNPNLINGSKVCEHSSQWSWKKTSVSAFAGNKITFSSTILRPSNNYGYFLYDNINHLDTANEWKYNATAHILYYYPPTGNDPNFETCEVSSYQNGIELGTSISFITISNLSFEKQSNAGVQVTFTGCKYITVDQCDFAPEYNYGLNMKGKYAQISNSYFREIDGMAIYISGTGVGSTVHHSVFRNNGMSRNNGLGGQLNGTALMCSCDSNYFHHNDIDSAGYCGISADGGHNLVERNIINHAVMIENDGAAIKGWG